MGFFDGLFGGHSDPEPAETNGAREQREAREAIVKDLASRIHDVGRADQVRELPGGEQMVTEAIQRSAGWWR